MFDALRLPRRFEGDTVEDAFLEEFRRSGLRLAKIAFSIAAVIAITFWAVLAVAPTEAQVSLSRQHARVALAIVLAAAAVYLHFRASTAIKWFPLAVGLPMALACLLVGSMGLMPLDSGSLAVNRFVVAMTLTCWLCYGFTRLPTAFVCSVCVLASLLTLAGVALQGDDHTLALSIYLITANTIGWVMSVEIERRERALFWNSKQLRQTTHDLAEMARKANQAHEAKTRVLAAVSHDLRQPLASLTLYAQLLRENRRVSSDTAILTTVDSLDACIGALSSDLDRLSELGLRERGAPLPVEPVDLRSVLQRVERVYSGLAIRAKVRLVVRLPSPRHCLVASNESRLWDVLANLVANALKFSMPERDAWVLVRIRPCGKGLEVVVRDNGIGIDGVDQARVFDEYFQVSNAARSAKQGQGLGLSIVRETLSRLPDHAIRLASTPGRGARFAVYLPLVSNLPIRGSVSSLSRNLNAIEYPSADAAMSGEDGLYAREPRLGCYRDSVLVKNSDAQRKQLLTLTDSGTAAESRDAACVLIVEDDETMRSALSRMFEQWGFVARAVADGEDALSTLLNSQCSFDVIVSDFRLPGAWDGLRLIEKLRCLEGRRTPAILLSGEFRVEALRCDAPSDVQVLGKPPDVGRLRELLFEFARRSGTTEVRV